MSHTEIQEIQKEVSSLYKDLYNEIHKKQAELFSKCQLQGSTPEDIQKLSYYDGQLQNIAKLKFAA